MRQCNVCKLPKEDEEFHLRKDSGTRRNICKKCHSRYAVGRSRIRVLAEKYGMTVQNYDDLLEQQNGRCAICKMLPGRRRLAVDHDHVTGKVRGLLCSLCNPKLGVLEDANFVVAALRYLKK